jgi:hypothetical protein
MHKHHLADNPTSTLTGLIQRFTVWLIADQAQALVQLMAATFDLAQFAGTRSIEAKSVHCFW